MLKESDGICTVCVKSICSISFNRSVIVRDYCTMYMKYYLSTALYMISIKYSLNVFSNNENP